MLTRSVDVPDLADLDQPSDVSITTSLEFMPLLRQVW